MKIKLSKTEAKERIDSFFKKSKFSSEDVKKMKRLGMKYNIKLGIYRKKFCKKCLSKLKGKTRITKSHKSIECEICGNLNRFKLS